MEPLSVKTVGSAPFVSKGGGFNSLSTCVLVSIRVSQSMEDKNKLYKELVSLKPKKKQSPSLKKFSLLDPSERRKILPEIEHLFPDNLFEDKVKGKGKKQHKSDQSSNEKEADMAGNTSDGGLFSLRKKIDEAVLRAEMLGPSALELEEASQIKQEEMLQHYDLWDDVTKSNKVLTNLADTTKVVHNLKDLRYKVEEAKLITQLAERDAINYGLFKQAYNASIDVSKFMDRYQQSKLLSGPYDADGACIIIRAGSGGVYSEIWAERVLSMYLKWAEKQGYKGRLVENYPAKNGGIKSATLDFEFEYAYGYLSCERGSHIMIRTSSDASTLLETSVAYVDVIPLFLEKDSDMQLDDKDLVISSALQDKEERTVYQTKPAISIRHIPTGISVHSSGERNHFANKTKALNRLKAKLLVVAMEQGVSDVKNIRIDAIANTLQRETRRYISHPYKVVQDVKTGIQMSDLNSVMDGNIEPFIVANISTRLMTAKV